jgi:hypothetical protein
LSFLQFGILLPQVLVEIGFGSLLLFKILFGLAELGLDSLLFFVKSLSFLLRDL